MINGEGFVQLHFEEVYYSLSLPVYVRIDKLIELSLSSAEQLRLLVLTKMLV